MRGEGVQVLTTFSSACILFTIELEQEAAVRQIPAMRIKFRNFFIISEIDFSIQSPLLATECKDMFFFVNFVR